MQNYHEKSLLLGQDQIKVLAEKFEKAWTLETCYPTQRVEWSSQNKALGQCAVTAVIVQELYGGTIASNRTYNHVWNILPDGTHHDFTRSQFLDNNLVFTIDEVKSREDLFQHPEANTVQMFERYQVLKNNLNNIGILPSTSWRR